LQEFLEERERERERETLTQQVNHPTQEEESGLGVKGSRVERCTGRKDGHRRIFERPKTLWVQIETERKKGVGLPSSDCGQPQVG
jgi:hypothetical protein